MTLLSEKVLISDICISGLMPNLIKNSWTDSSSHILFLGYRVLLGVIPQETERIRQMMEDLGLNPDDDQENYNTPVGIGNLCGNNVVRDRLDDGVNQVNT